MTNRILEEIEMESDLPVKNEDLPILDMKCWTSNGYAMYTHYEKPTATKQVISARSAHPESCALIPQEG